MGDQAERGHSLAGSASDHVYLDSQISAIVRHAGASHLRHQPVRKCVLELPRFGGHVIVLVSDSVFPDFIDLTPQRSLPPSGGRGSSFSNRREKSTAYEAAGAAIA